ncbi:MAG: hemerythrin domain-containing protein [Verrucomicrobiota bacterium]
MTTPARILGFWKAALAAGLILSTATPGLLAREPVKKQKEQELPITEDLMREHGVLKRILLIYGEAGRRLDANEELPVEALASAAKIIRSFVEDYHEKLEETYVFPRFEKAHKLADLVTVLRAQHEAGRRVTGITLKLANAEALKNADNRSQLAESLRQFVTMYNPHEAREDTVLFPAFREIVSPQEFDEIGEQGDKKEEALFGEHGFEKMVEQVAAIEKQFGIGDLSKFTPTL